MFAVLPICKYKPLAVVCVPPSRNIYNSQHEHYRVERLLRTLNGKNNLWFTFLHNQRLGRSGGVDHIIPGVRGFAPGVHSSGLSPARCSISPCLQLYYCCTIINIDMIHLHPTVGCFEFLYSKNDNRRYLSTVCTDCTDSTDSDITIVAEVVAVPQGEDH